MELMKEMIEAAATGAAFGLIAAVAVAVVHRLGKRRDGR